MIKWDGEAEKMSRQFFPYEKEIPHISSQTMRENNKKTKWKKILIH